ncbi:MAG: hypothetical protein ACI82Z_000488, partial [Cellvibrionaceae bacterium]
MLSTNLMAARLVDVFKNSYHFLYASGIAHQVSCQVSH